MIDLACVFTTGGVILFYKAFCNLKFDAVDALVKKVLVQDKATESSSFMEPYMVKWKVANDLNLIFVVVYQEIFHLLYIDELLEMMKNEFKQSIYPNILIERNFYKNIPSFDKGFNDVIQRWETKQQKNLKKDKIMRSFQDTDKGKKMKKGDEETPKDSKKKKGKGEKDNKKEEESDDDDKSPVHEEEEEEETQETKQDDNQGLSIEERKKAAIEKLKGKSKSNLTGGKKTPTATVTQTTSNEKIEKKKTTWGTSDKIDKSSMRGLDFSSGKNENDAVEFAKKQYLGEAPDGLEDKFIADDDESEEESEPEEEAKEQKPKKRSLLSKFTSSIQNVTGNMVLTEQDLNPILVKFKEGLMEKNVAEEIAEQICGSLRSKLIDTKTKAFTSISKTIKEALTDSLTKILTPKRNIDLIAEAMRAKEKGKPYVIVFIGVNGVGKSTNLAKVAHLLKTKGGFSVMLAACDNFRAGAIEQIQTHGRCLEVPVIEKGYKSDPPLIAAEAIREAIQRKIDCVLIDTAGRMQNNEPLMKSLARLVDLNQPDLVIFVGEALAGNDGVDQLTNFNKSLIDMSSHERSREIDAVLVTKFDTVDDRVGACVSLTYATGKPILFVGTGQKYTHLRKLNVKTVVHSLLN